LLVINRGRDKKGGMADSPTIEELERRLSLLIVDDEANFLALLHRVLSKEGYEIIIAHGCARALRCIERERFDLAVLDVKMHPMSGVELLAEIKNRNPLTQVLMVTGYPTDYTREESVQLGAAGYLTKPIDMS